MLMVALACAGDSATPTSPPTSTSPAPTATSPASTGPTATPVPQVAAEGDWIERYLKSPGYKPEWGQPVRGGTFIFSTNRDGTYFDPHAISGCYVHGCGALMYNTLFRIDPWVGKLDAIEGDLVKSWNMSEDGTTLTMNLHEGVMFQENPNIPAEYNGGKIGGDEFVCEDAKASMERIVRPAERDTRLTQGAALLWHLESLSCPDGPRGHSFVMRFSAPLGRTVQTLAAGGNRINGMVDKDWIQWMNSDEHASGMADLFPNNFLWQISTGPFVPVEINPSVGNKFERNPNYWREGLPLLDRFEGVVIKDNGTRFTALATGKVHFFGEGSYGFTAGQAEQALRDFPTKIEVNAQMNNWARAFDFSTTTPPFDDVRARKAVHLA